ncbi:TonB-dependent receptor domain-containing protein [Brucellaceae bacterium C25G]
MRHNTFTNRKSRLNKIVATGVAIIAISATALPPVSAFSQSVSNASANKHDYQIRAQTLTSALVRFSNVSGINVVSGNLIPSSVRSSAIRGSLTPQEALAALLAGTGYRYTFNGASSVTITNQNKTEAATDNEGIMLQTITVGSGNVAGAYASGQPMSPETPYYTPAATSMRTAEDVKVRNSGSIIETLRTTPGVFTREVAGAGGTSVNIRGHEGRGRVNMMIDGVRQQNPYLGHYANGGNIYLMPEFLAGIDMTRGNVAGNQGFSTLAGAANFRTFDVDDVLLPGQNYGGMTSLTYGTNGYRFSRMGAAAARTDSGFEVLAALARRDSENYRGGKRKDRPGRVRDATFETPISSMFKLNYVPNEEIGLRLSALLYENEASQHVKNDTFSARFNYAPADNDLINLRIQAYYNPYQLTLNSGLSVKNKASGFDIANTSLFNVGDTIIAFDYGAAYYRDDITNYAGAGEFMSGDQERYGSGTRVTGGGFVNSTVKYNILTFSAGLRYDVYNIDGSGGPTVANDLSTITHIDETTGKLNPSFGISADVLPWLQPYVSYAHTYRAPQVGETLMPGAHGYYSSMYSNPGLRGEESKGWEIGANVHADSVIMAGDKARLKVNYFTNRINNYIITTATKFINSTEETRQDGFEIEGSYDAGFFYANVAYTHSETDVPYGRLAITSENYNVLPKEYFTVDTGLRFFDERFVVGGRLRYVSESLYARKLLSLSTTVLPSYTLYDAYTTFKFNDHANLFASVENIGNKLYAPALDTYAGPSYEGDMSYYAGRGRTYKLGVNLKF